MSGKRGTANPENRQDAKWCLDFEQPTADTLLVRLSGAWRLEENLPGPSEIQHQAEANPAIRRMAFDTQGLTGWDTSLLIFLGKVIAENDRRHIETDHSGLPDGVGRLLNLAAAVPERADTGRSGRFPSWLARLGLDAVAATKSATAMLAFLGEALLSILKLFRGTARFRRADFFLLVQGCGAQALPIVTLISYLVGVILAYVGAVQLRQFGAQIYVADLVGIAMTREMGAMMAAIIMAGRTGAAFAAELGTMQVNEEIDALTTLGISPMEFLVLPRMLALALMMPLLCIYADLMGILGGASVGLGMLDLGGAQYYHQTAAAIGLDDFLAGLLKSAVFGMLVAIAGCLRGMECGRSSAAVGWAATSAVVTGIVSIIVSDAIMTVIFDRIGL
jgi:phospholipid/cholesterol/gamma-HCH transport system permease protein